EDFNVGGRFRSALVISSAFDASIEQTLVPLVGGGAVVVISDAIRESPAQVWQQLIRNDVTFMSCVPSYLESIIGDAPENASLQHLVLGGEVFASAFAKEISRRLTVETITNLYGPTETTIDAVGFLLKDEQAGAQSPIGRPLPNYGVYVLDSCLEPVPVGVVGELYISGAVVARLPEYMMTSAIVVVDGFPLTANGKLDGSALPAPEFRPSVGRLSRSPQEELLCALFAEVLGVERVGIDDNFFALGGESIVS